MSALRRLAQRLTALPSPMVAGLLAVVAALLAARLLGLTWLLAVNVPFSDQWALLTRLYNGFQWSDAAIAFIWQHGPHRQGLNFSLVLPDEGDGGIAPLKAVVQPGEQGPLV